MPTTVKTPSLGRMLTDSQHEENRFKLNNYDAEDDFAELDRLLDNYGYVILGSTLLMHPTTPEKIKTYLQLKFG